MRRSLAVLLLLVGLLHLPACATTAQVEARDKLLAQLRDNLANDIGPKYKRYLDADKVRPVTLTANDYGVVTDSVAAIDRVLAPVASTSAPVASTSAAK